MLARLALSLGAVSLFALSACETPPPQGNTGGRIDPYRQTQADQYSREVSSLTLLEFADEVAQKLSERMSTIPEITGNPTKVAIELGDILNETATPTSDFRVIQRRISTSIVNNDILRQHANVYEAPERMDAQADRFGAHASADLFDDGYSSTNTARYDPADTFLLMGSMGEIERGPKQSTYYFTFDLVNLASRQRVFSADFESKEIRG